MIRRNWKVAGSSIRIPKIFNEINVSENFYGSLTGDPVFIYHEISQ